MRLVMETSTATILAYAIFAEGVRNVAAGASAIDLKRGIDRGIKIAVESLRGLSKAVQSRREKEPPRRKAKAQRR
jgi:chaperonin GroEL